MTTGDQFRERIIPQMLTDGNWKLDFARGFIWNRWYPNNWEWVDHRIKECETESQKAWLLVMTRFSRKHGTVPRIKVLMSIAFIGNERMRGIMN